MEKKGRQCSKEPKLQIIQEAELIGLQPTLRKYSLSQSLFHKWKRSFNEKRILGLGPQYPRVNQEKRKLEQEIKQLRVLVGELSLELRFKDWLFKKSQY